MSTTKKKRSLLSRDTRVERTYPHPRELVWRALTDRALIGEWLMPNDFTAEEGARFTMRTEPQPGFDGTVHCEVLELDAPRRMRWSWVGGPLDTEVTFTLEETIVYSRPATRLVVEHTGFEGLPAVLVSFILGSGNRAIYGRILPALLDSLAAGGANAPREACTEKRSAWQALVHVFAPILRRGERERRSVR